MDTFPFWLDTGASIHISPIHTDFLTLTPIHPHPIKGLGGSSILTTGTGDIKLCVEGGTELILQNILYIPEASVHLISIYCLAHDLNTTIHFNHSQCWITNKSSGSTIVHGHLLPHENLYTLTLCLPLTECALSIHPVPNIETWH